MKVVVEIPDEKMVHGIKELKKLDFIESISEEQNGFNFDQEWSQSDNLTIEQARIITKNKVRVLWSQK